MTSILVVGFHELDAGKTILTGSLVSILRKQGYDSVAVKPLAGVNLWESPWIIDEIKSRKLIVSGDAVKLSKAMDNAIPPEILNPVTVVYAPADPSQSNWRLVSGREDYVVLGRVSRCGGERVETFHFVNVEALDRVPAGIAASLVDAAGKVRPFPIRVSDEFVERVLTGSFIGEVESCMSKVLAGHDIVVFESNSDVAVPTPSSLGSDLVLVVGRGVIGVVDGERWAKAVEVLVGSGGLRSLRVQDVLNLTGVRRVHYLPFLSEPLEGYREQDLENLISYILSRIKK